MTQTDYPDDKYGPSCLILGFATVGKPIHVQCSYPARTLVKITRTNGSVTSSAEVRMKKDIEERFVEQKVSYTLEIDGRFVIVENVPARIFQRTGERFFSPETAESLQRIVWGTQTPTRVIQTPVFEYPKAG